MSTDYDVVCRPCNLAVHIGQRFSSGWAFGYGSNDAEGRLDAGNFILEHVGHGDLAVVESENHNCADDRP